MDNIRHLSLVGDPGGISLEKEIDIRRGGDEDRPLHHPSHPIHLLTLQRESLGDRNIPIKRIHLLLPLRQYPIVEFVTMADTREIDAVLRLYSVVIETPDNNNDNYRQIQTSLSVGDPGRISLDTNIDQRRRGYRDQPLHPPLQILHLKTHEREI